MKLILPQISVLSFAAFFLRTEANYCNWSGCSGVPQGCCGETELKVCNDNESQCESGCGGEWCSGSFGYCSWSTCDGVIRSTEWCNGAQSNCEGACGGMWCTNGGSGTGTTPSPPTPTAPSPTSNPAPINPSAGSATTTRYWDCSGGACGCAYLPSGPGTEAHCHSNAMFAAPSNNQYGATYYGTAAVSQELFGYNTQWLGEGCGTCYKLTGTSNIPGTSTVETTLVLKAANLCPPENPSCSGNKVHFDISAPGFDVTQYSFAHTCPSREPENAEGFSSCEFWMINSNDPTQNCDCSKFNSPVLEAGCNNFLSLNWDNPTVTYEAVECPMELDRLNCWEDNGNQYPFGVPDFCESNVADGSTPTTPMTSPPTDRPMTKNPTKSPVATLPTENPTKAPVTTAPFSTPTSSLPTKTPTKSPTLPPTKSPTPPPVAPSGGSGSFCCSNNFKDCNISGWCGANQNRCENTCGALWIEEGSCSGLPKYSQCTNNINGCCAPATCQGNQWYKQCL